MIVDADNSYDGQGSDLRYGIIPQSGNLGFALFALQILLMPTEIPNVFERKRYRHSAPELRYWNFGFLPPSRFDRASSIAGMAEIAGGDRLGPRHI